MLTRYTLGEVSSKGFFFFRKKEKKLLPSKTGDWVEYSAVRPQLVSNVNGAIDLTYVYLKYMRHMRETPSVSGFRAWLRKQEGSIYA
jgi:hypothetical protein